MQNVFALDYEVFVNNVNEMCTIFGKVFVDDLTAD